MLQKQRLLIGDQKIWDGNEIHYYLMNSSMQYDFWLSVNQSEVLQLVEDGQLYVMAYPRTDSEDEGGWEIAPYYNTKQLLTKYAYVVDDYLDEAFEQSRDHMDYQNLVRPHIHRLMFLAKKYNQPTLRCGYIRNLIERYHMVFDGMRTTQAMLIAV